jgi:type VI secretion system secreted protein VgrG
VVTTPGGEEIHCDALGRIKVHFYWDREGALDDTASCWVRVQQQNTATSLVIPRVGWEVDVGFEFGDPDRPVVLQKLYNRETLPPYELPASLARSALQSSTSPGGGGTNEIRLDDTAGAMEFFVHAQRNLKVMVGHDHTDTVGVDASAQVGAASTESVAGTESITVGGHQSASVTGSVTLETVGARTVSVGANDETGVTAMYGVKTAGARTESIGGLMNVLAQQVSETFNASHTATIGGAQSINSAKGVAFSIAGGHTELVGAAKVEAARGAKQENIGAAKSLTAGIVRWKTGGDMTVASEGAMAWNIGGPMQIKAGGAVTLSGSSVTLNIAGSAKLLAGAKVQATPASVKIQGGTVGGDGAEIKVSGTVHSK